MWDGDVGAGTLSCRVDARIAFDTMLSPAKISSDEIKVSMRQNVSHRES
jgi:hypothetical protein